MSGETVKMYKVDFRRFYFWDFCLFQHIQEKEQQETPPVLLWTEVFSRTKKGFFVAQLGFEKDLNDGGSYEHKILE